MYLAGLVTGTVLLGVLERMVMMVVKGGTRVLEEGVAWIVAWVRANPTTNEVTGDWVGVPNGAARGVVYGPKQEAQ